MARRERDYSVSSGGSGSLSSPDAANDVTFGNLGDIKAGDNSSDIWEPDHWAQIQEREAEKLAFLRQQQAVSQNIDRDDHYAVMRASELANENQLPSSLSPPLSSMRFPPEQTSRQDHLLQTASHVNQSSSPFDPPGRLPGTSFQISQFPDLGFPLPSNSNYRLGPRRGNVVPGVNSGTPINEHRASLTHSRSFEGAEKDVLGPFSYVSVSGATPIHVPAGARLPTFPEAPQGKFVLASHMRPTSPSLSSRSPTSRSPTSRSPKLDQPAKLMMGTSTGQDIKEIPRKRSAKLQSMTDRDLEFVLRMHLKQLEATDSYTDDYYHYTVKEKLRIKVDDLFAALAARALSLSGGDGSRKKKKYPSPRNATDDVLAFEGKHTAHNLEVISNALGTLQAWNPKAPRKSVDFGNNRDVKDRKLESPIERGAAQGRSAREDDRIAVRTAVERGYDLLASIHDVVRGKSQESISSLISSVFDLFRLPKKASGRPSFFLRMCAFPKGKRFVSCVLPLLNPTQKCDVVCALMSSLGALVERASERSYDSEAKQKFWNDIISIIIDQSEESAGEISLSYLSSFARGHGSSNDLLVSATSSNTGASTLYSALQAVYVGLKNGVISEDSVNGVMAMVYESLIPLLGDIFVNAESLDAVWRLAAMLDALATPRQQRAFRVEVQKILNEGKAPPPIAQPGILQTG